MKREIYIIIWIPNFKINVALKKEFSWIIWKSSRFYICSKMESEFL